MKSIIETAGQYQFLDSTTGFLIPFFRPSVPSEMSAFIHANAAAGYIKILGSVSDTATDEEFLKTWEECEGDKELAVSSFVGMYPAEGKVEAVPAPVEMQPAPAALEVTIEAEAEVPPTNSKSKK